MPQHNRAPRQLHPLDARDITDHWAAHNELMLRSAVDYAQHHWPVYPLSGKTPRIPGAHLSTVTVHGPCIESAVITKDPLRGKCHGGCGRLGHGHYDATTDLDLVTRWWSQDYPGADIGVRFPATVMDVEFDPRHGGHWAWRQLLAEHPEEPWPDGMQMVSGRGDGGRHHWMRRPPGLLRMPWWLAENGVELKLHCGILAPSRHETTGQPYQRIDGPIPTPPSWFVKLITVTPDPEVLRPRRYHGSSPSPADTFNDNTSWAQILEPHGWECLSYDPDDDDARWRHPDATCSSSATIRNECLFVYTPNTPFDVTEPGIPKGYTKFRAHAVLNYHGDMSAAAKDITRMTT
jgi:hypothetical protein